MTPPARSTTPRLDRCRTCGAKASRQQDQLVEERKRLGAQGNALLLSQGFGSWKNWWRPQAFKALHRVVPEWLLAMLQSWVDLLRVLDEKIQKAKAAQAKGWSGPRPKGAGANSLVQLQSLVLVSSSISSRMITELPCMR